MIREVDMSRLAMRPSTREDCEMFAKWEATFAVREFFSISEDRCYEEVLEEFEENDKDPTKRQFTLYEETEGRMIGRIYITRLDESDDCFDLTRIYIGDLEERGKGYGEEAMRLVMKYCFEELRFHRLTLDHFTGNEIGACLYKKLGFKYEGIAREAVKKDDKYYDLHLMSLLDREYFERINIK